MGIFTLLEMSNAEVILADSDRHLDVKISLCKQTAVQGDALILTLTRSTVVRTNNLLGWLYLLPVVPLHKRIVPAMLAGLAASLT